MPKPGLRPDCSENSLSSSAQKAWRVPRLISFAVCPRNFSRRDEISPAALLVNVNAQILSAGISRFSMRNRMRSMRQKVFPAPGPARTRTGPTSASIAARWEGDAVCGVNAAPEIGFLVEKSVVDSPTKQMFEGGRRYAMGTTKKGRLSTCLLYTSDAADER